MPDSNNAKGVSDDPAGGGVKWTYYAQGTVQGAPHWAQHEEIEIGDLRVSENGSDPNRVSKTYIAVTKGTTGTREPGSAITTFGIVWEYVADNKLNPWTWDIEVLAWSPSLPIPKAGVYCKTVAGEIFQAKTVGSTGLNPPVGPAPQVEAAPEDWTAGELPADPGQPPQPGQTLKLGDYRALGGRLYKLVDVARPPQVTTGGPTHTGGPAVADSHGNAWAYGGTSTPARWNYLRPKTYNSSLTGISIANLKASGVGRLWTAGQTGGDDSFVAVLRAAGCRGTAITLNVGFLSAGTIFIDAPISGINERYVDGTGDEGSFAVDCGPESKLLFHSLYLQGYWRGGVRLGNNCHIEGWCQPDAGAFRTATGTFLEFASDVRRATGRITMSYDLQRIQQLNYVEVVSTDSLRDGDLMTWGTNNENQLRVLSAARNASTDRWIIVYRPLPMSGGLLSAAPPLNMFVKFWRNGASAGSGTAQEQPRLTLLQLGIVGTTAMSTWEAVERNFEIVTHAPTATIRPYRNIQSQVASSITTNDRLQSNTASGSEIWSYFGGALRRHGGPAFVEASQMWAPDSQGAGLAFETVGQTGYAYRAFTPGTTDAQVTNAYCAWTPPDSWDRGPLSFQYYWVRGSETSTGSTVIFSLQGAVSQAGLSVLGAEAAKTDAVAEAGVLKISPAGPVTVAGAESWKPGMPIVFRVRRRVAHEGADGTRLAAVAKLIKISLDWEDA